MLRINSISGGSNAANYFGGNNADYYLGEKSPAYWHGQAAQMLGLSGRVIEHDFTSLMNNRKPDGSRLTQRDNPNRRGAYDFTFNIPKSVTLLHAIANDPRIEASLRNAVDATMHEIQRDASVRVRRGGQRSDRVTSNMVWADFVHHTSRPVNGQVDPNLHIHAVAANCSWDAEEGKWKALEIGAVKAQGDYYQSFFRQSLANQLKAHGYQLRRTEKNFEVAGIPERAIQEFSRRTQQIEALNVKLAAERGFDSLSAEGKAKLGATSREAKIAGQSYEQLQQGWISRLSSGEYKEIIDTYLRSMSRTPAASPRTNQEQSRYLDQALNYQKTIFFPARKLLTDATYLGLGNVSATGLQQEVSARVQRGQVLRIKHKNQDYLTTRANVLKEMQLVDLWKQGRGQWDGRKTYKVKGLTLAQNRAIAKVVGSRDRVGSFRGMLGSKRNQVTDAIKAALPDAIVLDQPTLDEALRVTENNPNTQIVLIDTPRQEDGVRQTVTDVLEDLVGSPSANLSNKTPLQDTFSGASDRLRRMAERIRQSKIYERLSERISGRQTEPTHNQAR